ncbi:unnamed protein product [Calicophoron daubneyi]|uniref:Uncharacterized protein n=1 Tax=Calicophoron daubneyi TaxID=300641 RepID=A0AAV2T3S3_CALDB
MNPNQPYDQQRNFSPYPQPGSAGKCPYPTGQGGMPQYEQGPSCQQQGYQGPYPQGPGIGPQGPYPPGSGPQVPYRPGMAPQTPNQPGVRPQGPCQSGASFQGPYQPGLGPQGTYPLGPQAKGQYQPGMAPQQPYPSIAGSQGPYSPKAPSQGPSSATAADKGDQSKCSTKEEFKWIHCSADSHPPPDAVEGEGGVYVIRHEFKGDMIPGKWPVRLKKGYVSSGGKEIEFKDFEVLCIPNKSYQWLDGEKGKIPPGAVVGGKTSKGETLYVARGRVNNEPCLGKVHPSHQCAYYPWGHKEHKREKYSVLCFL